MSAGIPLIPARKGDIVAVEQVRSATGIGAAGTKRWSEWTLGVVASADRQGRAKTVVPAGQSVPIKPRDGWVRFYGMPLAYDAAGRQLHTQLATDRTTYKDADALRAAILAQHKAMRAAA